ncbi:MAG: hypothetical protein RL539_155, partial [Pseudomonadota bacterium]
MRSNPSEAMRMQEYISDRGLHAMRLAGQRIGADRAKVDGSSRV